MGIKYCFRVGLNGNSGVEVSSRRDVAPMPDHMNHIYKVTTRQFYSAFT